MKKLNYLTLLAFIFGAVGLQAQFDDLYYTPSDDDTEITYSDEDFDNASYDDASYDDAEYDDFEYWSEFESNSYTISTIEEC